MSVARWKQRLDDFQQRHAVLAFPVAVWKKFTDDQGGNLAALLAFYGFVSLFPLLLVLVTILGVVLRDYPTVQQRVLDSALVDFPVIGDQIKTNLRGVGRSGLGLAFGIIGSVLGARGLANAAQDALNRVWAVPFSRRPDFPFSWLRSYGIIAVLGVGVLATTVLSAIGTWAGDTVFGAGLRIAILVLSFVVNIGLFWLAFRLATAREVSWRDLKIGALVAAAVWQGLQAVGGYVVAHQLRHASSLYGVFGLVLGLLAWLYLQSRLTLYAVEIDVVRARRLWPRTIFPPPLTPEDKEAYRSYAEAEERVPMPGNEPEAPVRGVEERAHEDEERVRREGVEVSADDS